VSVEAAMATSFPASVTLGHRFWIMAI